MTIVILALVAVVSTWAGRRLFGTWFNHFTMYSVIWGASLILFELRFIDYYPLEVETWIYIGLAWFAFTTGSLLLPAAGYVPAGSRCPGPGDVPAGPVEREKRLFNIILFLSLISLAAVIQHWMILLAKFGNFFNVFVLGNIVYSLRLSEGISVGVPYLDSLALTASFFAGVYNSSRKRFSLISLLPFIVVIAEAVGLMGRMKILIAVILFLSGYFLHSHMMTGDSKETPVSLLRRWSTIAVVIALFALAGEFVRTNRGIPESIPGSGHALNTLRTSSFITPSVYLYLTVHHGVFNQYLKRDEERVPWGSNTFAPARRFLSMFGFATETPQYPKFYSTPANANSGSYLRELHADFGMGGVVVVPFFIGYLCSLVWMTALTRRSLIQMVILAHLFVVVDLSFILMATRLGYWLVSLMAGVLSAMYIGRRRSSSA